MGLGDIAKRVLAAAGLAGIGAYVYARYAVRRFEDLTPETAGAPGSFLDIDGQRVHYVEAGRGEAVVLIHGWNGSTFDYRYVIPELAQRWRVVAVDLIGFGYSERPAKGDYSLAAQARVVRLVMDRLGIDRATVVGHSMGGGVAMCLAGDAPERVSRLVLVDSVGAEEVNRARGSGSVLRPLLPIIAVVTLHRARMREAMLRVAVHDPAVLTPDVLEGHFRPFRMRGHLRAMGRQLVDRRRDTLPDPALLRQPSLILWGEHDRVIPIERGEALAREMPHARLLIVRAAGHLPLEEQPAVCNKALLDFLGSPEPASAAVPALGVPAKLETAG